MRRLGPTLGISLVAVLSVACGPATSSGTPAGPTVAVSAPTESGSPQPTDVLGLVPAHDPGHVTGTLVGPCHLVGDSPQTYRPDPRCTPGSYDPSVTAAQLCAPGYTTSTYRAAESETNQFKWDVAEPAYGQDHVTGELDHLVSLELGGSNSAANLWVEPGSIPNPKDSIENRLHGWVCAVTGQPSEARLQAARIAIAQNWTTALKVTGA